MAKLLLVKHPVLANGYVDDSFTVVRTYNAYDSDHALRVRDSYNRRHVNWWYEVYHRTAEGQMIFVTSLS